MCIAAMEALRDLVKLPVISEVAAIYPAEDLKYGPDYIIPKPFDPRLREMVSSRVSAAAIKAGVAALPSGKIALK
ncbi:MAG: malate dehydrogenase, partial [Gammaproteobacteria bacterium]|nr:malate dehydrogenase [Gammaproteobacteria bacterium]